MGTYLGYKLEAAIVTPRNLVHGRLPGSERLSGTLRYGIIQLRIYSIMDYIVQENAWSSSSSTSQRMKLAIFKVFLQYISIDLYRDHFHASDELLQGPEVSMITS